eukprot:gene3872-13936_t
MAVDAVAYSVAQQPLQLTPSLWASASQSQSTVRLPPFQNKCFPSASLARQGSNGRRRCGLQRCAAAIAVDPLTLGVRIPVPVDCQAAPLPE